MGWLKTRGRAVAQSRRILGLAVCCASARLCVCASVAAAQTDDGIQRIARDVIPTVERATGLPFKHPPRIAVRTRDQVRTYLDHKLDSEYPPAEMMAVQRAYRAFHLIADTTDLRRLMVDLYAEQVAGFYEPDSAALFVVRGADPMLLRLILAHELVHALQDQYTRLNTILKLRRHNDRQMAGQAVMEGQATVASLRALTPDRKVDFSQARELVRQQQSSMPVFAAAPRLLRESLLFPYLSGAEFVQQFEASRARTVDLPYGPRLPVSTEQILHFDRYRSHEMPVRLEVRSEPGDTLVYDDDFGEFETRIALEEWGEPDSVATDAAAGWNGDRFVLLGTKTGTALVWATAWDSPADAQAFERALRRSWTRLARRRRDTTRAWQIDVLDVSGVKIVRLVDASARWGKVPGVRVLR